MLGSRIIKRIRCKHEKFTHLRNIYGDEINHTPNYCRSMWECTECGKIEYRAELHITDNDKQ